MQWPAEMLATSASGVLCGRNTNRIIDHHFYYAYVAGRENLKAQEIQFL